MEKFKVSFTADNQQLKAIGTKHASDTYADIEAEFVLGNRWTDMDSVSAVWWNDFTRIATVLDPQGKCIVPHEVLTRKGCVRVNLVGSVMEGDELVTRLTSYSAEAVQVNEKIKLTGSETSEITPSQFEQFVAVVIAEVEKVTGMTAEAETLPAGSDATARYENGVLYLGIPQGIQGETGNGIESVIFNSDYSLTFDFTDGTEFTTPSIRGAEGNGIRSIAKTGTSGLVDTYTITFDDGSTTTYTVTNGAKGDKGDTGATPNLTIGTVETLEPTEDATATITGTAENPVLNLGIPQGRTGEVTYEDLESILPRDTASGTIASFPDGQSVIPMHSLKVSLEPIQSGSGTPSPDNVRPISGHTEVVTEVCGVNVWDEEWELGYYDTSGNPQSETSNIRGKNYIAVKPSTSYYFIVGGATLYACQYDADKTFINRTAITASQAFITNSEAHYIRFNMGGAYGTTYNHDISINYPSTDTEYHAYDGDTYTTSLGRTVYGGTLDVVSGELVVDRAMVDLGNATWSYNSTYSCWVTSAIANVVKKYPTQAEMITAIAEKYVVDPVGILIGANFTAGKFILGTSGNLFVKTGSNSETPTGAFVYELATPQTYQLTPQEVRTLLGTNNVWSDGDVVVVYSADTALWIEKKLNA